MCRRAGWQSGPWSPSFVRNLVEQVADVVRGSAATAAAAAAAVSDG